jgi:hypothetical protein
LDDYMGVSHLGVRNVCRRVGLTLVASVALAFLTPATLRTAIAAPDVPRDSTVSRSASSPSHDAERPPVIGLGADAGLPDGVMGSLVLRPVDFLRLQLGAGTNTASPGFRAGVSLIPLGSGPSVTLEGGHYLAGDADGLVQTIFGGLGRFATYVGKLDYTFFNAHTGLDFGSDNVTFFLHGGVTYMRATLSELDVPLDTSSKTGAPPTTLTFREDPVVRMWTPSVKLGVIFFLQ